MSFKLLSAHLHTTALEAKKYFTREHGAKSFQHEATINKDLPLTPTLSAHLGDGCILCVEVSEKAYSNSLDTFVVECSTRGFPVKLYVVLPSAKSDQEFAANLRKAKDRGVGVIELSDTGVWAATEAVSLSLFGLRKNQLKEFPKGKREAVRQAEQTFLNGNPVKGCQSLYEELEAVTRAFAARSKSEGWWRSPHPGEANPSANIEKGPWAKVLKELATFLDLKTCQKRCPFICDELIASARGVTPRNLTSHKPSNLNKIIQRDRRLRTWFESTSDLLKTWYEATQPLKL
jgi:hypothetical protein